MKKLFAVLAALTLTAPALADPKIDRWKTPHAMGCMLLQECTLGVTEIETFDDIASLIDNNDEKLEEEFTDLLSEMRRIGIGVYVADEKYFPPGHRGVYHTVGNNFFLNYAYMSDAHTVLKVMRHEGWHAAQDCMAGTIENNNIAIIHHPDRIPARYNLQADIAYASMPSAIPWEREAMWAGHEPFMTSNALRACQAEDAMWDLYPPTPKTGEWLIDNGFWDGKTK